MKKIIIVYTLGISLLFSCQKHSSFSSSRDIKPSADTISPRFLNSYILLESTGCPESCKNYQIEIFGNGKATYQGIANVEPLGQFERILTPLEVNTLFNAFECASFFDFRQVYTGERKDSSYTLLTFRHRSWEKTIKEEAAAPEELNELQELVEDIREKGSWTKVNP